MTGAGAFSRLTLSKLHQPLQAQRTVRTSLVVMLPPALKHHTAFSQRVEQFTAQIIPPSFSSEAGRVYDHLNLRQFSRTDYRVNTPLLGSGCAAVLTGTNERVAAISGIPGHILEF
ncbi:MAG: hypothetical protein RLY20_1214 [Verrucomicrobiota bacterium]